VRVFISSTCYDLIDIRAHIGEMLRSIGVAPVMSDDQLSDFHVKHSASSIESCLVNVDSSDEVIVILDKRYGPRLGKYNFPDISATHLEYRRAVAERKPLHVFVRDRLEADHRVWSKNDRRNDLKLPWVQHEHDYGLFDIIEEHTALTAEMDKSNWYRTFSTSLDLLASVRHQYERRITPQRVTAAINTNSFPLLDIEQTVSRVEPFPVQVSVGVTLRNVGGAPAFNLRVWWTDNPEILHERAILPSSGVLKVYHVVDSGIPGRTIRTLDVQYSNPIGIRVEDCFELQSLVGPGHEVVVATQLRSRRFLRSEGVMVEVQDE
jgi:hypothetical protein